MRILICAEQAPLPPINGFRLYVVALLSELRREHDVKVVALRFPDQEELGPQSDHSRLVPLSRPTRLRRGAGYVVTASHGRPFGYDELAARIAVPLKEEIDRFRPDVVHVAGTRLAPLGRRLSGSAALLAPLDAAHLNVEARALNSAGIRRWFLRKEVARVRRLEATEYRRFRAVVVVSDADSATLAALDPRLHPIVIPNGVDTSTFAPNPRSRPDPNRIIFAGVMQAAPNVSAATFLARTVMPRVRASVPTAHLAVVGRAPVRAVRRLAKAEGVDVVGEVADMRAWLTSSRVAVCPMVSGTGIKNKLLEAMACGVPCVVSRRALRGLHAVPGQDLLVGDSSDELASHIVHIMRDGGAARRLGEAGRAYVASEHRWRAVGEAYVHLYESLVDQAALESYRSASQLWSERPPSTGMRAPVT